MKTSIVIFVIAIGMSPIVDLFPAELSKKLYKVIEKTWVLSSPAIEKIVVDEQVYMAQNEFSVFKVLDNGQAKGFLYLTQAKGRFDYFDYVILFNTNFEIEKVEVLLYRSAYGGEVSGKNWLKQFVGMKNETKEYGKDINAISGATISGKAITNGINEATKIMIKLQNDAITD